MQRDTALVTPERPVTPDPASLSEERVAPRVRTRAGHQARRVRHGLRRPANWFQLVRFGIVGFSGYVINLIVYSLLVEVANWHYVPAAVLAFCVAVSNNFLANRHWTFNATDGRATFQAPRFLIVSLVALAFNLLILELLVGTLGMHKILGQAVAILAATPLNFVGNKLWSFGKRSHRSLPSDALR
jgi:dolichol-phosphate mannosyltransferase